MGRADRHERAALAQGLLGTGDQILGAHGATTVQRQLMQIARAVRDEELVARPEQTLCSRCAFMPICPAHAAGSVLS